MSVDVLTCTACGAFIDSGFWEEHEKFHKALTAAGMKGPKPDYGTAQYDLKEVGDD